MYNKEIDSYIEGVSPFAIPILKQLRELIHSAIPNIEEKMKWKMPSFELDNKMVCSFAGYKKHCVFRFWNGHLMDDPDAILLQVGTTNMKHIGNIEALANLPKDDILKRYIKDAGEKSKE